MEYNVCPQVCEEDKRQNKETMTAIHTELATIFGGMNVNEAELKIQYIRYRPSLPYDSKSPVTFTIPGNTTPYVSLRDSYLFVQCHVEKQTSMVTHPPLTLHMQRDRSIMRGRGGGYTTIQNYKEG